jgi:hypothetical protein
MGLKDILQRAMHAVGVHIAEAKRDHTQKFHGWTGSNG